MKARVERSRTMIIIGCDYHPGFQQIAFVDTETGDYGEQRLEHSEGAEKFYRDLAAQGKKVRVGMEASGHARWFERLLAELNFELTSASTPDVSESLAPPNGYSEAMRWLVKNPHCAHWAGRPILSWSNGLIATITESVTLSHDCVGDRAPPRRVDTPHVYREDLTSDQCGQRVAIRLVYAPIYDDIAHDAE